MDRVKVQNKSVEEVTFDGPLIYPLASLRPFLISKITFKIKRERESERKSKVKKPSIARREHAAAATRIESDIEKQVKRGSVESGEASHWTRAV